MDWKKYPENTPVEHGYYMTVHVVNDQEYIKAIYWNGNWMPWRRLDYELDVREFVLDSRAQFYTQCLDRTRKLQDNESE